MKDRISKGAAAMVLAASMLAGCTAAGEPQSTAAASEGRDCFWPSQVSGFTDAGNDRVYIHTGPSEVYLFDTFGSCPDLDFTEHLALERDTPGMICRGIDVTLIVPSSIGPRRCPVSMIRKLSPEEARKH